MTNLNHKIVRAQKEKGVTLDEVRASLKTRFAGFRIAGVYDKGDVWEALLEKPLDKTSVRTRTSEFPPPKNEGKPEGEPSEEPEESDSDDDGDSDDEGGEKKNPFEKGDGGDESEQGAPDLGGSSDPFKEAVKLFKELERVFKSLSDKANVVDDVHKAIKPHVQDGAGLGPDGMGGPPGAPGDVGPGAGAPPSPGLGGPPGAGLDPNLPPGEDRALKSAPKAPPVPRRPMPAQGLDRRRKLPGAPVGLSSTQHKIVFHPWEANGKTYTISQAIASLNSDPRWKNYRVASIQEDIEAHRYVAKLELSS